MKYNKMCHFLKLTDSYYFAVSLSSSGNLLRILEMCRIDSLCADTTALSMGKTGASTSALFPLKSKECVRKENIHWEVDWLTQTSD